MSHRRLILFQALWMSGGKHLPYLPTLLCSTCAPSQAALFHWGQLLLVLASVKLLWIYTLVCLTGEMTKQVTIFLVIKLYVFLYKFIELIFLSTQWE
jgi:hypothetical protein